MHRHRKSNSIKGTSTAEFPCIKIIYNKLQYVSYFKSTATHLEGTREATTSNTGAKDEKTGSGRNRGANRNETLEAEEKRCSKVSRERIV